MPDPVAIESVQRLDVQPGETLVLKLAAAPTDHDKAIISEQLRQVIPNGVKYMLLGPGMDIVVVSDRDIVA